MRDDLCVLAIGVEVPCEVNHELTGIEIRLLVALGQKHKALGGDIVKLTQSNATFKASWLAASRIEH